MHELAIAEQVLEAVRSEARKSGARAIGVGVRVGRLSCVEPDALDFALSVLVKDTDLDGLVLEIERVPVVRRCPGCGTEFRAGESDPVCPACGDLTTEIVGGDELELAWLDVEEPCRASK